MERLKLIVDKIIKDRQVIVYNRRIIKYDPEKNETPEEKYMAENIK